MTNGEKYKTARERVEAFVETHIGTMTPLFAIQEFARWLDLKAEEENPLPCPFCGGETIVRANWNSTHQVVCNSKGCWYCSKCETTKSDAIAAHNRVAKNCREVKE